MTSPAELEAALYATWTPDESGVVAGWHLTATGGLSRRVNSARDIGEADVDDAVLETLHAWFDRRGIPFVIRETPLMTPATSAELRDRWAYAPLDETIVMEGPVAPARHNAARIVAIDDGAFQRDLAERNGRVGDAAATLRRVCGRVADRGAGIWLPGRGVALAVVVGDLAAVFSLAVSDQHRRQGIARQLMDAAFNWAEGRGASKVFVQVVGTNDPAVRLYESLGFTESYRYRYLVPANEDRSK